MVSRAIIAVAISLSPAINRSVSWSGKRVGVTVGRYALSWLDRRRASIDA
jgi:hypothetical protein